MKRAGVTWFALSLLLRVAYAQVTDECLIGLVLYAGESTEFLSPNANLTCPEADVFFSNGSLHQKIPVKNNQPPCTEYPLIHLSLPDDAPLGPGKIVWQCDEGGPAACQVISVQAATLASAAATEYYLSQECVTNYPRTSLAANSSPPAVTTSGVDADNFSTPVDTLQESQDASQVSDGAVATPTHTQTNGTPVGPSRSSNGAFLAPTNATWVATTPLGQGQPPLSSGSLPGQTLETPPPYEDTVPTQPLETAPPQGTDASLTDASPYADTTSAHQDTAATSSSDALGQDGSSPLIVQCICQC
ncbi:hypothetical protein B0J13DRAFT_653607 [Dactylonectria estremocensis]|uniref:Uncharacterized protein n=1 Tax=Dactylonectria estremocensis TaxID=1079267 RepID=A0A9P9DAM1_9HYPO|nr:hypothetical protein B0J13DRAFT_653607 [Dactylonectria estremocensis]